MSLAYSLQGFGKPSMRDGAQISEGVDWKKLVYIKERGTGRGQVNCKATQHAQQPAKSVSVVNLGCPKNTVDAEVLLGDLSRAGFQISSEHEGTDAIIVNTCAFIDDAKAESLQAILEASELKKDGQTQKVVVTGCLAQRYSKDLAESIPEADLVMGFENYGNLSSSLQSLLLDGPPADNLSEHRVQVGEATVPFRAEWDRHSLTPSHTAYLRVAEGCSHACTFCAIPRWR